MNNLVKAGEVMKLKDLISYEEGSISNLDVASTDTMKFVLMAFDKGTGLTPSNVTVSYHSGGPLSTLFLKKVIRGKPQFSPPRFLCILPF